MATMQVFTNDKWVELPKGSVLFAKAKQSGVPIKVVHPNGNFKVIFNAEKLPKSEPTTSTKPKAKPKAKKVDLVSPALASLDDLIQA